MSNGAAGSKGIAYGPPFDVAVVGGGVVGCAVARRFALEGARAVLLERGPDILCGASRGNSAILHTGFDAPPGSREQACIREGYSEYLEIRERLNLPVLETDALVVAWSERELARLDAIAEQAWANGVTAARRLGAQDLSNRAPHLGKAALGAVLVPGEHIFDPWSAPLAYLRQALENGAAARFGAAVEGGAFDGQVWRLETSGGPIAARHVINCAGLYGDLLDRRLLGECRFTIKPRKGQFVVFDKIARRLVPTIILPVPTERTKGVLLAPTIFGNVLVGPTAEEQDSRDDASTQAAALRTLIERAVAIVPALAAVPVTASFAGIRPASEDKDYHIHALPDRQWITVGGIRSTGLTAALGIARHVFRLYQAMGNAHTPPPAPKWPAVGNLAEHRPRDWSRPGYGEIVCHCEMVTEREIRRALEGPLPAGDLSGLKRRTRAMLGRCQGFYCSARIAELTRHRFAVPLDVGDVHG